MSCWCTVPTGMAAVSLLKAAHPTVASTVSCSFPGLPVREQLWLGVLGCVPEGGGGTEAPLFLWDEDGGLSLVSGVLISDVSQPFLTGLSPGLLGEPRGEKPGSRSLPSPQAGRGPGVLSVREPGTGEEGGLGPLSEWAGAERRWGDTCFPTWAGYWEMRSLGTPADRGIDESQKCGLHELRIALETAGLPQAQG